MMTTTLAHEQIAPNDDAQIHRDSDNRTHRVTQRSVSRAEWIKFRTVRTNLIGLVASGVALVLFGMLFASLTTGDAGPTADATDSISVVFGGLTLSQLIIGVLAALFVAGEYSTGMIRSMFSAVGRRSSVLRAKAIVFGGATWVAMTAAAFVAFFAGQAVYAGNMATYSIGDPGVLRAVLAVGFYGGCVALIGIALGFVLRSTASAIGVLVGLLMLAPVLVRLVPGELGDTISKILPSNAANAMMSVSSPDSLLSPWQGLVVLLIWVVGLLTAAWLALRSRDA